MYGHNYILTANSPNYFVLQSALLGLLAINLEQIFLFMSAPIVAGILSYGMSGRVYHAPFLSTNSAFKLKAVVERHEKKAAERYPDIISYDTVDELLNDPEIELIIVNTPSFTHYDFVLQVLNAGKHVLVEKPITATVAQVKELYDLARKVNRKLMVYQNRRWDSSFLSVKEVIESGRLGKILEVQFRYDRYKPLPNPKKFKETPGLAANGMAFDLGPHMIDNVIELFGRPLEFTSTRAMQRDFSEVDDYFHFHLTYPNQLHVYITAGILIAEPLQAFVVHGSLGSYLKGRDDVQEAQLIAGMLPTDPAYGYEPAGCEGKLVTVGIDNKKTIEMLTAPQGDYNNLFNAVYHTIRNNALYPITEEHIVWQIELLEN